MQSIIQASGTQYVVEKGQKIIVNRMAGDVGSGVDFDVLMTLGDKPKVGTPVVDGEKVSAKITRHFRGKKIVVYKYKRRKGYHKTQGHRQDLTELEIL